MEGREGGRKRGIGRKEVLGGGKGKRGLDEMKSVIKSV